LCAGVEMNDMPLKERFERASQELSETYVRKARLHRAGVRPYTDFEFRKELHAVADKYDLFAVALWAYFRMLVD
jgi:hypothetical protein